MTVPTPLSILDLATVARDSTPAEAFEASVALARAAERHGYARVWYAEHHNMPSIASSATAVLIAHIANHTSTIRLGSGGVMLPNHPPLVIAEQFGTLATLHPDRIDLGIGRAPGTDMQTVRALRRDAGAAHSFPGDVRELQAFLDTDVDGVRAIPGTGTKVPIYVLGSSTYGAQLAAEFGLPYAFASHFAPAALQQAVALYRAEFQPSEQLAEPYVIAGANVIACDTDEEAADWFRIVRRSRARRFLGRSGLGDLSDEQVDTLLETPQGQQVAQMLHYSAVGSPETVAAWMGEFVTHSGADEVITVHSVPGLEARLRSVELLAQAWGLGA
ncbi:LLM class flavin-dependent oxidoreductase [Nocardioides limicola]|uniref:LLM class flavin-dependent oxidoreductase n=1 Tax=Nocardioides limicola TaxID=2803368 RepID=UPI00193BFE71|nr:LLM class flavin-dependent oxidoreductase [Nocardioides sp. DJM-14]